MGSQNKVKILVKQGTVIGRKRNLPNGNSYISFQGVPYAKPPLGHLRFKSPVPLERFNTSELDCTTERSACVHRCPFTGRLIGSEDCLFLNVFTPETKQKELLPVMVWIHGGAFTFGSGNSDIYSPLSLLEENVVVVTFNYRLGPLGFLSLPDEGIYGNAGLKDQRLVLQWVAENINQFGGDVNNVTIFGESGGAACVHLHAYSNHANKLFHKIIMQSGTANMEWVFQSNPSYKAHQLAELLGYTKHKFTCSILEYLQLSSVTSNNIVVNSTKVLTKDERRRGLPIAFKPVIESSTSPDSFLNDQIFNLLQKPKTLSLPAIIGYNSSEGMAMLVNAVKKLPEINKDLARFVPRNITYSPNDPAVNLVADEMKNFYFQGQTVNSEVLPAVINMLTDYHFLIDAQYATEWHVRHQHRSKLFFYRFDYVGEKNQYKRLFQFDKLPGACHGDELFYLFQSETDGDEWNSKDMEVRKRICRMWANFAREGNPTPVFDELINFKWLPVEKPQKKDPFILDYLIIDDQCSMQKNPDEERVAFWRHIYSKHKRIDYSISSKL